MVGILYCQKSTLDYKRIESLLLESGIDTRLIAAEALEPHSLDSISVLMNAMGSYYPADKLDLLTNYWNSGKNIINLSATPFTKSLYDHTTNNRALRSFYIVDDFCPIKENSSYVQTFDNTRAQISLSGLHGAVYHLSKQDENGANVRIGYLEHILDAYNAQDELIAAPIIRAVMHAGGSMTFFGFDFDAAMLEQAFWKKLFLTVVRKELLGNVLLHVDCGFARYLPKEQKDITVKLENISLDMNTLASRDGTCENALTLSVCVYNDQNTPVLAHQEVLHLPYEGTFSPDAGTSSLYKVVASVYAKDVLIAQKTTGFLVISDDELANELSEFKPMYIDESISTDYCLVDGQITAILGTTYFVTDVYRECFYYMNAWLCDKEMAQLSSVGFNTLRSGNWKYIADFYNADGSLGERGKRALQTYFTLAARNGFTVQFALGNIMLNQWDTSRSPIHDLGMREKCMTFVRSFAENFKDYPNVTLDIVNEPSYSMRGAWSPGKPSGEPGELVRYREWIAKKYHNNIHELWSAWGDSSVTIKSFDDIELPGVHLFSRGLCRTELRFNPTPVADFFAFAREEFLDWTAEVRATVKAIAPDMIVTMGRDETLRIPTQQDEAMAGNVDMVCWHQWNYNSNIINEYLLNRVRGKICVAQELGMYKYDDIRCGKRHTDDEMVDMLQKKLLYSFGNFIQWQAHDDPFMYELCENSLGLYRADMSPTPSLAATKALIAAEKQMQSHMRGRRYDKIKIASVFSTSHYFSVDNQIAHQGIKSHIQALYNGLKEQSDFVPEHLFKKENASAIGNPNLIILPAMQMLRKDTWNELLKYVKNGAVLLISGCIDYEEHFAPDAKIGALDASHRTRKMLNFEKLTIGENEYVLDFRPLIGYGDVTNMLNCGEFEKTDVNSSTSCAMPTACVKHAACPTGIVEYAVGNGTILYCPYPLELSTNTEAVCACYRYAMEKASAQNGIYEIADGRPNVVFSASAYEDCTVYTVINEGYADTITWLDLCSGKKLTATLPANNGSKIWLDASGNILQVFGAADVTIG